MSTIKANKWENLDGTENYKCRAWVNFNGTTTPPTIRASGNVSSVVRNGIGSYTVNFTTALADANYCAQVNVQSNDADNNTDCLFPRGGTYSATALSVRVHQAGNTLAGQDGLIINVPVFR